MQLSLFVKLFIPSVGFNIILMVVIFCARIFWNVSACLAILFGSKNFFANIVNSAYIAAHFILKKQKIKSE